MLEQLVARLPRRTAEWVRCHRPTSLAQAIQLAEDHLAAFPGVGEPRPNLSLSLSLPPSLPVPSLSRPVPAPRSRLPVAPRAPPRSGNGQADRYPRRGGGGQSPLPLHIRAIRSLLGREETPVAAPSIAHVPLMKMGPHDDPEAIVDLFEKTAEACGWARSQWPVRLIPLLTGEAQVAAQQLPVANLLAYEDLKRAILQRVGRNPEQHRQRFRSDELGDSG